MRFKAAKTSLNSSPRAAALAFGAGGFFLVYYGQVVLGVVQPEIQAELGLDHDRALWVLNAFMLGLAALVPLGGRLADVIGPRATILAGLTVFALGSFGAALADGFGLLVASLAVQGSGAGIAIPATVAIVAAAYPPEQEGHAVGRYAALGVLSLPVTPVVAGALVETGGWRWTFWLAIALTAAVCAVGVAGLRSEPRAAGERIDATGALTSISGLGLLLGGAVEAGVWGWTSPATLAVLAAGLASLAVFAIVELRRDQPLLDLALLRNRTLASASGGLFLVQLGTNCFAIFIAIYLLTIVRLDPLATGLALLPALALTPPMSLAGGALHDRFGARAPALVGTLLGTAAFAWLATFTEREEYAPLIPGFVLIGLGLPISITALLAAGAGSAPARERGQAAGVLNAARWVGATVGTVAFGAVLAAVRESRLDSLLADHSLSTADQARLDRLVLSEEDAQADAAHDLGSSVVDAVADAFTAGYSAGLWMCCAAFAVAAAIVAFGLRGPERASGATGGAPGSTPRRR